MLAVLFAGLAAIAGAVWLAIDAGPDVALRPALAPADIERALALLKAHDPRRQQAGSERSLTLGTRDLDLLAQALARHWPAARARVQVGPGSAELILGARLAQWAWLNLHVELAQTGDLPRVQHLRLGRLPLPASLAWPLLQAAASRIPHAEPALKAAAMARQVWFEPGAVRVAYRWDPAAPTAVLASLFPQEEQTRLKAYAERLVDVTRAASGAPSATGTASGAASIALPRLMAPLFELARARSAAGGAAAENRAALLCLGFYANGRSLAALVPAAVTWPRATPLTVTLEGRDDLPLHLLVSALLAVEGTSALSKVVGLHKELADARNGSGFSFTDIAADRAGTRLGELLQQRPAEMQALLAAGPAERVLMPHFADLPEFMPEAAFRKRFGGVGAPAYQAMLAEIDRRVAALPLPR